MWTVVGIKTFLGLKIKRRRRFKMTRRTFSPMEATVPLVASHVLETGVRSYFAHNQSYCDGTHKS